MNACPYSSNAHLSDDEKLDQLIIDWVRIPDKILFEGGSLKSLLRNKQIDLTNESVIQDGAVVLNNDLRTTFKEIISDQMFGGEKLSDKKHGDIAGILQQGGIVFRLNKHIELKLAEKGLRFLEKQKKLTYFIITPADHGVNVLTHFKYTGNIVEIDDVDIVRFESCSNEDDLISARCKHQVRFSESHKLCVEVSEASLMSPCKELKKLICSPIKKQEADDSASASASASAPAPDPDPDPAPASASEASSVIRR